MVWLVTEDSNSARLFWEKMFQTFLGNSAYKANPLSQVNGISTAGNKTLIRQVNEVLQQASENDTIFVVLDNIANTKQFVAADFIINMSNKCKRNKVNFEYTKYYCFEELYVSYSEVERLYSISSKCDLNLLDCLKYVRNCILNGIDYYDKEINEIQYILNKYQTANKNREHFANVLLGEVTRELGYGFWFSKSGKHSSRCTCWMEDCMLIQNDMSMEQKEKECDIRCRYCCKNKEIIEKLSHLKKNSLMKLWY